MGLGKATTSPFHYPSLSVFISSMPWKRLLAYITDSVDQGLLLRNKYLATENKILRGQIHGRLRLSDGERKTLAVIGKQLERKALQEDAPPAPVPAWKKARHAQSRQGKK